MPPHAHRRAGSLYTARQPSPLHGRDVSRQNRQWQHRYTDNQPYRSRRRPKSFAADVIRGCIMVAGVTWIATPVLTSWWTRATKAPSEVEAIERSTYYAGCNDARAAGVTPIYRGSLGYREGMDGDGDGIACE